LYLCSAQPVKTSDPRIRVETRIGFNACMGSPVGVWIHALKSFLC
jgi:hypothetical protein